MRISDWSSDVCSSDLDEHGPADARTGHDNVIAALYRLVAGWFDRFLCMCGARKAREHGDSEQRSRKVEFAASGRGCPSLDHVFFSALNPAKADRTSVVSGKCGVVRVNLGGRPINQKKKRKQQQ